MQMMSKASTASCLDMHLYGALGSPLLPVQGQNMFNMNPVQSVVKVAVVRYVIPI